MWSRRARATLVLAGVLVSAAAQAKTIEVFSVDPAVGTPIQDAIAAAADGDTIRVYPGIYREALTLDKRLKVIGVRAVLDGGCTAPAAIDVLADGVQVRNFVVYGGGTHSVRVAGSDRVKIIGLQLYANSADDPLCPAAQFGIHVSGSTNVKVSRNEMLASTDPSVLPYQDAGFYVGGIPPDGRVVLKRNFTNLDNPRGIVIADTSDAPLGPYAVQVTGNRVLLAQTGVLLTNADGIQVIRNQVVDSSGVGIDVDATSNHNLLKRNTLNQNAFDARDTGSGNCWRDNIFVSGVPTVPDCSSGSSGPLSLPRGEVVRLTNPSTGRDLLIYVSTHVQDLQSAQIVISLHGTPPSSADHEMGPFADYDGSSAPWPVLAETWPVPGGLVVIAPELQFSGSNSSLCASVTDEYHVTTALAFLQQVYGLGHDVYLTAFSSGASLTFLVAFRDRLNPQPGRNLQAIMERHGDFTDFASMHYAVDNAINYFDRETCTYDVPQGTSYSWMANLELRDLPITIVNGANETWTDWTEANLQSYRDLDPPFSRIEHTIIPSQNSMPWVCLADDPSTHCENRELALQAFFPAP